MKFARLLLALTILVAPATLLPQPPQRDVPGEVDSARNALKQAHNELQHAGGEWGGHRVKAMQTYPRSYRRIERSGEMGTRTPRD